MNEFVNYLNSTNNVGGNTTGALAEAQVKSIYYDQIKVDRTIGDIIIESIQRRDYKSFILTGHAGDGKTSILVQVLKKLNYLPQGQGLEIEKDYPDLFYVKDMSEIADGGQVDILEKALVAPMNNKSSILISNTGPLLKAMLQLEKKEYEANGQDFDNQIRIKRETEILRQLDTNSDAAISIAGHNVFLINIARVDNVHFSNNIFKKILDKELWKPCLSCSCNGRCPIKNNVSLVSAQFERVALFIEYYYRYLFENDKRMTIRQMVGQISYAITGNLSCDMIQKSDYKDPFFRFNFANLFFGYKGIAQIQDSLQIQGIKQLRKLAIDEKSLDVDYQLFVNNNFSYFNKDIREILTATLEKFQVIYRKDDEYDRLDSSEKKKEINYRKSIRRFFLIFSQFDNEDQQNQLFNQLFGSDFVNYVKVTEKKQNKAYIRRFRNKIFNALYVKNTGFMMSGDKPLYLTLRRDDGTFQNVMLVLGEVKRDEFTLIQKQDFNIFEDNKEKYHLVIKFKKEDFDISLPMLNYFDELINGSVSSDSNPALTHGIAKLDTLLIENYGYRHNDEELTELRILINTVDGPILQNYEIEDGKIDLSF